MVTRKSDCKYCYLYYKFSFYQSAKHHQIGPTGSFFPFQKLRKNIIKM